MKKISSARQIGQVIRKKRTALGLTQQQLADAAHVSRGFINRIEKGTSAAVYPDKLLDVFKALNLSLLIENDCDLPRSLRTKKSSSAVLSNTQTFINDHFSSGKKPQIDPNLLERHTVSDLNITTEMKPSKE